MPSNLLTWVSAFWKIPDAYVLTHQSLDAYLFLRYLRILFVICVVSFLITWPILLPINATGGKNLSQLEVLSYSDVDINTHKNYLYAHTFVGWAVYGFLMYMITRECIFYINLRQAHHINPHYTKRISARIVLFTSVPDEYNNEERIRSMFNAVKRVWVCGKTDKLDELVKRRDNAAMKLEMGEINLLKAVNKARAQALKKGEAQPEGPASGNTEDGDVETGDIASRWIPDKKRPHHRLGPLGLIGEKVNTIEWSRNELQRLVPEVEKAQADWRAGNYEKVRAVFVEFETQGEAQYAFQSVTHHQALHMDPKAIGVLPGEIIWKCLSISWWQVIIRRYAVYGFIAALIILWAIPIGIIGLIPELNMLKNIPGLTWIGDIPKVCEIEIVPPSPQSMLIGDIAHTRSYFRFTPSSSPLHCHVVGSRRYATVRQTRRRSVSVPSRAFHTEFVLFLPAHPGVLDRNLYQRSLNSPCADCSTAGTSLHHSLLVFANGI